MDQVQAMLEAWLRSEAERIYLIAADPKLRGLALLVYSHSLSSSKWLP